jgi:hypothetical protein
VLPQAFLDVDVAKLKLLGWGESRRENLAWDIMAVG